MLTGQETLNLLCEQRWRHSGQRQTGTETKKAGDQMVQ